MIKRAAILSAIALSCSLAYGGADMTRDAFGRSRVSEPYNQIDLSQLYDSLPLFYDTATDNASVTHSTADSATTLAITNAGGYAIQQTKMRGLYQPGKSLLVLATAVMTPTTGTIKRVGYFTSSTNAPYSDSLEGIWFESDGTNVYVCLAKAGGDNSSTQRIAKADWNLLGVTDADSAIELEDSYFDGAGIYWFDVEWLGVGSVRAGVVRDGAFVVCHQFDHAGSYTSTYTRTMNMPVRYEIRSGDSQGVTNASDELITICASVSSEGGYEANGVIRSFGMRTNKLTVAAGTAAVLTGFRLNGSKRDATVIAESIDIINAASTPQDDYGVWELCLNPTITNALTWTALSNSSIETVGQLNAVAVSDFGATVASGYVLDDAAPIRDALQSALRIGSNIDGSQDEMILIFRSMAGNPVISAEMSIRETP